MLTDTEEYYGPADDTNIVEENIFMSDDEQVEEDYDEDNDWFQRNCGEVHEEKIVIVFVRQLKEHFRLCRVCKASTTEGSLKTKGTLVTIQTSCSCGRSVKWHSQPLLRRISAGN